MSLGVKMYYLQFEELVLTLSECHELCLFLKSMPPGEPQEKGTGSKEKGTGGR